MMWLIAALLALLDASALLVLAALHRLRTLTERLLAALDDRAGALAAERPGEPGEASREEARCFRDIDEGITNLLRYAAGKVPGAEAEL